jgi:hypothetical protein
MLLAITIILTILVIGLFLYNGYLLNSSGEEHLEEPVRLTNKAVLMAPTETPPEVDGMDQRKTDIIYENSALDNSDMIQDYIQKGSSIFQPGTAQGVTTTSSAQHSNFTLAQPGMYMEYSVPINGRGYNADEALARKQQHRSSMNKRAIDGAVRSTRNIYQKYFTDELNENEEREWWTAEAQPIETDFRPYY